MKSKKHIAAVMGQGSLNSLVPPLAQTLVEAVGDRRLLIENHRGMLEYSKQIIAVKTNYGTLNILGRGLQILQMTKTRLIVGGCICELQLVKGQKP